MFVFQNSGLPPSVLRPQSDTLVFPGLSDSDAGTYQVTPSV